MLFGDKAARDPYPQTPRQLNGNPSPAGQKCAQGDPPEDPLLAETVLCRTAIGFKWIIWVFEQIGFGAIGPKCVPRAFP